MPHKEEHGVSVVELHPTFAAEVQGVDFSQDISPDVFDQIYAAITQYGVSHQRTNLVLYQSTEASRSAFSAKQVSMMLAMWPLLADLASLTM